MEILLALIVGGSLGAAMHFVVGGRSTRGAALAPILGTLLGGATWLALTWAGLTTDGPWIRLASFAAPLLTAPVLLALWRVRAAHDTRERARLRIA